MGKCSARRKARFMCTFRTPRQTASKAAKCILSSSFVTQAQPWRLEGAEPTFPGTWEWVVLPDMGGTFDKVEERLLAGSSLFLFSIVVSIPTRHAGDRGSIPTISQKRRTSSTLGRQPITPEPKHLHIKLSAVVKGLWPCPHTKSHAAGTFRAEVIQEKPLPDVSYYNFESSYKGQLGTVGCGMADNTHTGFGFKCLGPSYLELFLSLILKINTRF